MEKQPPFKVIIIGGSIVGLTLAHCLDHAGIDYVVLEKHEDPHPQLGAFVGIMPNGARVLEQLGLYDKVKEVSEPIMVQHSVFPDGFVFTDHWPSKMIERLCLSLLILSRQQLIRILYTSLKDKSRIRLKKKVIGIHPLESGVSVSIEDGDVYYGDLVVGADGVHSMTRSELWRVASEAGLGEMTLRDKSTLAAEYSVIFGISTAVPGITSGEQTIRISDNLTVLVFGGKKGSVGWGVVQKLDQKYTYPHIPRFTQEDAIATAKSHLKLPICKGTKFGDIWERRVAFSMTALEEGILQTWYHGRIVCIGDSINKMTPNMAQGANSGIECAAALGNVLHRLIQAKSPDKKIPSDTEVTSALAHLAKSHFGHLKTINSLSYLVARIQARDGLISRVTGRYIPPLYKGLALSVVMKAIASSVVLEYLPLPASTRKQQELLKTTKTKGSQNSTVILMIAMTAALLFTLWLGPHWSTGGASEIISH